MMLWLGSTTVASLPLEVPYLGLPLAPEAAARSPAPFIACGADSAPAVGDAVEHAVSSRPVPADAAQARRSVRGSARAPRARREPVMYFGRAGRANGFAVPRMVAERYQCVACQSRLPDSRQRQHHQGFTGCADQRSGTPPGVHRVRHSTTRGSPGALISALEHHQGFTGCASPVLGHRLEFSRMPGCAGELPEDRTACPSRGHCPARGPARDRPPQPGRAARRLGRGTGEGLRVPRFPAFPRRVVDDDGRAADRA